MSEMRMTGSGKEFAVGTNGAEHCRTRFGMVADTDGDGRFTHRPRVAQATTRRQMLMADGKLPLFEATLASQSFNLQAAEAGEQPVVTLTLDKQVGRRIVKLYQIELRDVQPVHWTLVWEGQATTTCTGRRSPSR